MIDLEELSRLARSHAQISITIKPELFYKLLDHLEAAEKERDELRAEVIHIKEVEFHRKAQAVADGWRGKCERLEAKITEMERQEPVWFIDERGEPKRYHKSKADYCKYGGLDLLYALPGAKGE